MFPPWCKIGPLLIGLSFLSWCTEALGDAPEYFTITQHGQPLLSWCGAEQVYAQRICRKNDPIRKIVVLGEMGYGSTLRFRVKRTFIDVSHPQCAYVETELLQDHSGPGALCRGVAYGAATVVLLD